MTDQSWVAEFPGVITVCDTEGIILAMNQRSIDYFEEDGGQDLIGTNVFDCHPEPARTKLRQMVATQTKNVYTTIEDGIQKLVYQTPWYKQGEFAGFIEMILDIPL